MDNTAEEIQSVSLTNRTMKYKERALKLKQKHRAHREELKQLPPPRNPPQKQQGTLRRLSTSKELLNPQHALSLQKRMLRDGERKLLAAEDEFKERSISKQLSPRDKYQVIKVKYRSESPFRVLARPTETVKMLKQSIELQKGYNRKEQKLSLDGEVFADDRLVGSYKLVTGATVVLEIEQKVQISIIAVASVGEVMNCLEAELSMEATIESVKAIVLSTWGIPNSLQRLSFNGRILTDAVASLSEIGLRSGDCLELKLDMQQYRPISLRNTSGVVRNTIASKDQLLYDLIMEAEGTLSWEYEYYLVFEGKKLDYKLRFFSTDVPSFEVLRVERRKLTEPIKGRIRTLTGQCTQLTIGLNDMIGHIKLRLFELHNYPVKLQMLKLDATELLNHKKLSDYVTGTTFELDLRLKLRDPPTR